MGSPNGSLLAEVPAYNKAGSVTKVVHELHEHAPDFDLIVVDDGSTCNTAKLGSTAGAEVGTLPFNLGIGGARRM